MATVIKLKTGTSAPSTSDIASREVAIDTSAQKFYINDSGTIKEIGGADLVVPPDEVLKHPSKSGKELENEQIVKVVDKYYNNLFNSITKTFGLIDQDTRGAIYYHESDPNKFYTEEEMIAAAQSGEISAEGGWNVKE